MLYDKVSLMEEKIYKDIYKGKLIVIKISGSDIISPFFDEAVLDIKELIKKDVKIIFVFGGGVQIDYWYFKNTGKENRQKRNGVGITTEEVLEKGVKDAYKANCDKVKEAFFEILGDSKFIDPEELLCKRSSPELEFVGSPEEIKIDLGKKLNIVGFLGKDIENGLLNVNSDEIVSFLVDNYDVNEVVFTTQKGGLLDNNGDLVASVRKKTIGKIIDGAFEYVSADGGMKKKLQEIYKLLHKVNKVSITKLQFIYEELMRFEGSGTLCFNFYNYKFIKLEDRDLFDFVNEYYVSGNYWKPRTKEKMDLLFDSHYVFSVEGSIFGGYSLSETDLPESIQTNNDKTGYLFECYWSANERNGIGSEILEHIKERAKIAKKRLFCYSKQPIFEKVGFKKLPKKSESGANLLVWN